MKNNRDNSMFMPYPGVNMQGMYNPMMGGVNDVENRLNIMERQLKRIDSRLSRIESMYGDNPYNTSLNDQSSYQNTMHMM